MPTIKQIADACGVSKSTVRRKLEEMGLLEGGHATKVGKTLHVSDYAASAVSAALDGSDAVAASEPVATPSDMHERYIASLEADKARLEAQVADKDREIARLLETNAELTREMADLAKKVAEQPRSFWSRLLPGGRK